MRDLTDMVNGQVPTANEEGENSALKKAQSGLTSAVSPLDAKAKGLGPDAAKMAGTPSARQGLLNEQKERAKLSAEQDKKAVNPIGQQTADDYFRHQNIQEQTLGQAQENAREFEEKMAKAGSNSGQVSKYIMEETYKNLENAQKEPYIEQVLKDGVVQDQFIQAIGIPISGLSEDQREEMNTFISGLLDRKKPEELNLKELQESLGADNNDQNFQNLVSEVQKKTYETIQNIGDDIANGLIDAEDVTIRQLMEAELITETDVRDSLGLFNGEPLPDNWEEMSYAEIEQRASQIFRQQQERLDKEVAQAGLGIDAGGGYGNVADRAEARADEASRVQFGDQAMRVEDFLSDERVSQEASRLLDANLELEGEALDEELRRIYGDKFEGREEYYRQLAATVKANKDRAQTIDDDIETTNEAIQEVQQSLVELGIDGIEDILGINMNTWDLEAGQLSSVYQEEALQFINKYKRTMQTIHEWDPNFLASAKKRDDEEWWEYGLRLEDKLASLEGWETEDQKRIDFFNNNFDENGKFTGDPDEFLKNYLGIDRATLEKNFLMARMGDLDAENLINSLPREFLEMFEDDKLSNAEIEKLARGHTGNVSLVNLSDGDFTDRINQYEGQGTNTNWETIFSQSVSEDPNKLTEILGELPENQQAAALGHLPATHRFNAVGRLDKKVVQNLARRNRAKAFSTPSKEDIMKMITLENFADSDVAMAIQYQMKGGDRSAMLRHLEKLYKELTKKDKSVELNNNISDLAGVPIGTLAISTNLGEELQESIEEGIKNGTVKLGAEGHVMSTNEKWNKFLQELGLSPFSMNDRFTNSQGQTVSVGTLFKSTEGSRVKGTPKVPTRDLTPTEIANVTTGSIALPIPPS